MSLESLNDLIWWAVGSGAFSLGIFGNLFGGGSGSSPAYPKSELSQASADYVKTIANLGKGTFDESKSLVLGRDFVEAEAGLKTATKDLGKFTKQLKPLQNIATWKTRVVNGKTQYQQPGKGWISEAAYNKLQGRYSDLSEKVASTTEIKNELTAFTDRSLFKDVNKFISDSETKLGDAGTALLEKTKEAEDKLTQFQETQDASLLADLGKLNGELKSAAGQLDDKDKAEFQALLDGFDSRVGNLTKEYDERASGEIARGDEEIASTLADYEETGLSLGDRYLDAVDSATTSFDEDFQQSLDLSPERLSIFTQAADFLSQAAVETRMKMLATADPRALELSAIADENASAMMSGRISADTQSNLARSSAMRALQGGFGASSQMGRGLAARDLGLTALDLQQRGFDNYQANRTLNYNTRVAGLQADSGALLTNDMAARQRQAMTNYEVALQTAQSDRDQRQSVFNTGLAGNLARIDDRTKSNLSVAGNVFSAGLDANRVGFGASTDNLAARTRRGLDTLTNTWDRDYQSRLGIYNTNVGNQRQIYGTDVNTAGSIFSTRANQIGNNMSALVNTTGLGYQLLDKARSQKFEANTQAQRDAYQTNVNAIQNDWKARNDWYASNAENSNALAGNLISTGATIAGALIGTAINPGAGTMMGANLGSTLGGAMTTNGGSGGGANSSMSSTGFLSGLLGGKSSAGTNYTSFSNSGNIFSSIFGGNNYEKLYGSATGGNTGLSTPAGWSNWSNGV